MSFYSLLNLKRYITAALLKNYNVRFFQLSAPLKRCYSNVNVKYDDNFVENEAKSANLDEEPDILLDPTLSHEEREHIKVMKAEYEIWKYAEDDILPDRVTNDNWKTMLELKTVRDRLGHLIHLRTRSTAKVVQKRIRRAQVEELKKEKEKTFNDHLIYGPGHNTIFRRLNIASVQKAFNIRALNAYNEGFGPKIVIDMHFVTMMSFMEQNLSFGQIKGCIECNRNHRQPAQLIMTSLNRNEKYFPRLLRFFQENGIDSPACPMFITDKCYMDLFPRDRLIYLTPDGSEMLNEFDVDKVYIIGAIVDKLKLKPRLSADRAEQQGIATRKLPLDYYLKWQRGSKYLPFTSVMNMLLDFHVTNDWYTSMNKNVLPERIAVYTGEEQVTQVKRSITRHLMREKTAFLMSLIQDQELLASATQRTT